MYNKSKKEFFTMKSKIFKVLYFLLFAGFFLFLLGAYWRELQTGYIILIGSFTVFFIAALFHSIKELFK